jgi:glycosyltransferase involved in cell wall biosynthesis
VTVVCPQFRRQKLCEVSNGVTVFRYPMPFHPKGLAGYFWEYSYSLAALFLTSIIAWIFRGFNVVHTQNPPDFIFTIGLFYKLFGKKFIFDHNDLTPELYQSKFSSNKLALRFLLWQEKVSCRVADTVVTTGQSYENLEISRDGIPPTKIIQVRNSPNLSRIKSLVGERAMASQDSITTLGYLGYLDPQDGPELLLKSLRHLVYGLGRRDFHCTIIGDGEMLDELKQLSREMKIEEYVTFTGRLPWDEAIKRLADISICLEPCPSSPFNDKTSTVKVLEYMAIPKPIVAFDLEELHSVITGAALLAPKDNVEEFAVKITQLMDDRALRERMAAAGKEKMEKEYNWEHYATNLLKAYEKLFSSR